MFSLSPSPVSENTVRDGDSFVLSFPNDVIGLRSEMIDEEVAEEDFAKTLSLANDRASLILCANNCIKAIGSNFKRAEAWHCVSYTYYYIFILFSRNN
jgi:hypothetical protein